MKKIPTLFERTFENHKSALPVTWGANRGYRFLEGW